VIPAGLELDRLSLPSPVRELFREKVRDELDLPRDARVVGVDGRAPMPGGRCGVLVAFRTLLDRNSRAPAHESTPEREALPVREAPPLARESQPGPYLLAIGEAGEEASFRAVADRVGLADRIRWAERGTELPGVYAALDLVVSDSEVEGMPRLVIEALAAGVPVVARAVGEVIRVLEGGKWGTLVEDSRPEALAAAMAACLTNPLDPGARGAASARVRERYGEARLVREVGAAYRSLLDQRGWRLP
jgi:glycosyltransferase involved in cell wall biosynthesis